MSVAPENLNRRSFVYRELAALGAVFAEVGDAACAVTCGESAEAEAERARELAICDLSPLPRVGFKGRDTIAWLAARGVAVGPQDNMTVVQDDGARAARLAPTEVLLLADLAARSTMCDRLLREWSPDPDPGAYPVPRADTNCWFVLGGRHGAETLAKVCGIDVRAHKFPEGAIAQTSIARLDSIVLRGDLGGTPAYHVLTDSASASYMWACLLDAMAEFGGRPVGLAAIRMLATDQAPR